ncbi:MAG: NUDIX domain-containing protein [Bacteroidia bacterium]|nr:NUDIX domain-containing protein [Bacteroidia bacterium]
MEITRFNIRVYGLLINEQDQILVSDELIKGHYITKFPGGGLEFGEGIIDCLKREFMEETNNEIEVVDHFYTTDFFQQSAYNPSHQIISIYYLVKSGHNFQLSTQTTPFEFVHHQDEAQSFRWIGLKNISVEDFSLPIDKIVAELLIKKHKKTDVHI